jgi:hypothetical protein
MRVNAAQIAPGIVREPRTKRLPTAQSQRPVTPRIGQPGAIDGDLLTVGEALCAVAENSPGFIVPAQLAQCLACAGVSGGVAWRMTENRVPAPKGFRPIAPLRRLARAIDHCRNVFVIRHAALKAR